MTLRPLPLLAAAAVLAALPAAAAAAPQAESKPGESKPGAGKQEPKPGAGKRETKPAAAPKATVKIEVGGLRGGRATIWETVPVSGTVSPYAPGQRVEVVFYLDGRPLVRRKVALRPGPKGVGSFESSVIVREDGRYAVSARHAATPRLGADATVRKRWKVRFPGLRRGECSKVVAGFKTAMAKMGYASGGGRCFDARLAREVLAYRKVNAMDRSKRAGPGVVKAVYGGKGGFHVRYPNAGEHVEVSIDKQVMALIKHGRPFAIYPVSTGKSSTPTITGSFRFYRPEPGTNSHGMVFSWYFIRGYAVHGYAEVPNYPASHGCVRTFVADQPRIYEQLHLGEPIFVY